MRRLELDFRRRPRTARTLGIVLLAASVAGVVAMANHYQRLQDRIVEAESVLHKHGAASRKQAVAASSGRDAQSTALEFKRANEIALQLRTPWPDLFANVEAAQTPEVALLSIESANDKQSLKIAGEAKNLDAVLAYLRDLQEQPLLANVYLQSHQVQQQDPQRPVRFALGAGWRGQH
jgi:Tfp pilus assembly protein PilN